MIIWLQRGLGLPSWQLSLAFSVISLHEQRVEGKVLPVALACLLMCVVLVPWLLAALHMNGAEVRLPMCEVCRPLTTCYWLYHCFLCFCMTSGT